MTIQTIFLVGFGGFWGSIARYVCQWMALRYWPISFPFGTLIVNILGSLLIGLVYGYSERGGWITPEGRLFLATGFCGGFTTFSALSYESMGLLKTGQFGYLTVYILASLILGILATFVGFWLTK